MIQNGLKGVEDNNKSNIPTVVKKKNYEQRYMNKELVNTTVSNYGIGQKSCQTNTLAGGN